MNGNNVRMKIRPVFYPSHSTSVGKGGVIAAESKRISMTHPAVGIT